MGKSAETDQIGFEGDDGLDIIVLNKIHFLR